MADLVLHKNARVQCLHGGAATDSGPAERVKVSGMPVATQTDAFVVTGCGFMVGSKPQPCVTVRWVSAATRVKVNGVPVLLQSSRGVGESAEKATQGPATVQATQSRVKGS